MPTWLHILIAALIPTGILLGGSVFLIVTGQMPLAVWVPIPVAVISLYLYMKLVPARCPECGGKVYLKRSKERRFYHECKACGRVGSTECSMDE
jgi:hypothetical protein